MLGDQQVHVPVAAAPRRVQGDQVCGHLVADEDRRDDDRGHPADPGQPQRPVPLPRRPQHLAEPRVDQGPGGRGGQDVHDRGHHGDGRRRPVGQQLGDARQAGVLQRQARQLAVHRHQLAEHPVFPAEITRGAGREIVAHKRSIRASSGTVLVAYHKPAAARWGLARVSQISSLLRGRRTGVSRRCRRRR
jgi:hypothetical protein